VSILPSDLEVERQLADVRVAVIEATHHVRSPKRSTRYRTTRNLVIAAAAIAALTAGAIIVVQLSQETVDTTAACYPQPNLDTPPTYVFGAEGQTQDDWRDLCGVLWQNDMFDPSSNDDPDPNDGTSPIPELVACTRPDGLVAVFPAEDDKDFCETLGLADWDSD
jgi:hypothetical protein